MAGVNLIWTKGLAERILAPDADLCRFDMSLACRLFVYASPAGLVDHMYGLEKPLLLSKFDARIHCLRNICYKTSKTLISSSRLLSNIHPPKNKEYTTQILTGR